MGQLDLSQAKSLRAEEPQGPVCHRTMAMIPVQGGVAGVAGALLTNPCMREKCSLWVAEKSKCADAVTERA